MAKFNEKSLEEKISILREIDQSSKEGNDQLFVKSLILFPLVLFLIGFFLVNRSISLYSLILITCFALVLVLLGVFLLLVMEDLRR